MCATFCIRFTRENVRSGVINIATESYQLFLPERHISPEAFAIEFCHDIDISPSVYASKIVEQINTQLKDLSSISATKLIPAEEEIEKIPVEHLEGVEPDLRVILHVSLFLLSLISLFRPPYHQITQSMTEKHFSWMFKFRLYISSIDSSGTLPRLLPLNYSPLNTSPIFTYRPPGLPSLLTRSMKNSYDTSETVWRWG